jgi:hypothetical protein
MAGPAFLTAANRLAPQPSIPKIAYVDRAGNLVDVSVGGQSESFMRAMLGKLLED